MNWMIRRYLSVRTIALAELAGYAALCWVMLWTRFPDEDPAIAGALGATILMYPAASQWLGKRSWRECGLDTAAFWPALRFCLVAACILVPAILLASPGRGFQIYGDRFRLQVGTWSVPGSTALFVALYPVYAVAQQYIFLGFIYRRFEILLQGRATIAAALTIAAFVLSHLPNPILMAASLIGGAIFAGIFRRHRNFLPIAVLHALLGIASFNLLQRLTPSFAVGKSYSPSNESRR